MPDDLPVDDDEDAEVVSEARETEVVSEAGETEVEDATSLPPFPLPDFLVVVVVELEKGAVVEPAAADEVDRVVVVSFPALETEETSLLPLPLSVAELVEAVVVEFESVKAADVDVDEATDVALLSMAPGPAATALAANAAAASPLEPSLEASLAVVPLPITVNLVQSSEVPRWATGIKTG